MDYANRHMCAHMLYLYHQMKDSTARKPEKPRYFKPYTCEQPITEPIVRKMLEGLADFRREQVKANEGNSPKVRAGQDNRSAA